MALAAILQGSLGALPRSGNRMRRRNLRVGVRALFLFELAIIFGWFLGGTNRKPASLGPP